MMRVLVTIVDRELTKHAVRIFHDETDSYCLELFGKGTASTEMMDYLGLGSPDKTVIIGVVKASEVRRIFDRLDEELKLKTKSTGVAFSVPITSISKKSLEYLEERLQERAKMMALQGGK